MVSTINRFITEINGLGLPGGTTTSFVAKLNAAIDAFDASDLTTACASVGAFVNHVKALSGKKLTLAQANGLLAAAVQIRRYSDAAETCRGTGGPR